MFDPENGMGKVVELSDCLILMKLGTLVHNGSGELASRLKTRTAGRRGGLKHCLGLVVVVVVTNEYD